MAKKKTTTTVEEVEETPKDQELDYTKDLENKSFEQVAQTPKDEPKEEVKEEKPEEDTEVVEFDPEELKKEAVAQAKAELSDLLKGETKEETKQNVDEFQEYQQKFFKDNNRQPTWFEVAKFTKEQVEKDFNEKQEAKAKEAEAEQTKQKELVDKNNQDTNDYVKATLDDLYANDKLPKIQDSKNPDDYGLRTQKAFLNKVVEVNSKRIADKQTPKTLKEVFYEDFELPRKEVAGANAPTNMGRGGYTPDDSQEIDYLRDISGRRNSFKNIITNALKRNQ